MGEDEVAEVRRHIREAEADLSRARAIGNVELELKVNDRLNLLLRKEERLTAGRRKKTTRAPLPVFFYYEMYLRNVDASLTSLAEVKGFRNFVKAQADSIGVTGFIQRCHDSDLQLGFHGSEEQCDDFLSWILGLKYDYHMIGAIELIIEAFRVRERRGNSFDKIIDHSRLKEGDGTVCKGLHSDGAMDKLSEFSADKVDYTEPLPYVVLPRRTTM